MKELNRNIQRQSNSSPKSEKKILITLIPRSPSNFEILGISCKDFGGDDGNDNGNDTKQI